MSRYFRRLQSLTKMLVAVKNPFPPSRQAGAADPPLPGDVSRRSDLRVAPGRGDWPSVNGAYLWDEYAPVGRSLSPGDRVINIGANIGGFTVRAARAVGPTGQVIAAEPATDTFRQLQRNLALNNLTNTIARQVAVAETPGTARLHVARNAVFTSLYQEIADRSASEREEEVAVVTVAQLMEEKGWDRCHFLKLDCEGAEHGIIHGMSNATGAGSTRSRWRSTT